jgi:hypothetical protein
MPTDKQIEAEVRQHLMTDGQYPLGERDAMKWAVAWRLLRDKHGIDYNAADTDGWMVGWFANCMATGEMAASGGSFLNADGMQSIIDGEIESHPEFNR